MDLESLSLVNLYLSYKRDITIICSLVSVFISCWLISFWVQACNSCCCRLITHNLRLHLHNKLGRKQWIEHVFLDKSGLNSLLLFTWVEQAQWNHIVVCHVSSSTNREAVERSAWWHCTAPESFDSLWFQSHSGVSETWVVLSSL